jgi:hypothetical protein
VNAANERFLRMLRAELDDLVRHIDALVAQNRQMRERHEETEHVCFENIAVLKNERHGVERCEDVLDAMAPDDVESLDALIEDVRRRFRERVRACGLEPIACVFVERKLVKLQRACGCAPAAERPDGVPASRKVPVRILHEPPGRASESAAPTHGASGTADATEEQTVAAALPRAC